MADDHKKLIAPPEAIGASDQALDAHDTEPAGAAEDSIKAGHEPDRFQVRSVLYVPLLLVTFVLIAFGIVTVTFDYLTVKPPMDVDANKLAATESQKSLNERFAAISSTDPNARVKQPRLEYLKQTAGADNPNDPPFYRSKRPIPAVGATWELYPEDLRPGNFVDPTTHEKILINAGFYSNKKELAHIPIAEAMEVMLKEKKYPVKPGTKPISQTSVGRPDLSDSGEGAKRGLAVPGIIVDRAVSKESPTVQLPIK